MEGEYWLLSIFDEHSCYRALYIQVDETTTAADVAAVRPWLSNMRNSFPNVVRSIFPRASGNLHGMI